MELLKESVQSERQKVWRPWGPSALKGKVVAGELVARQKRNRANQGRTDVK